MATAIYSLVLEQARHLSPDERHALIEELTTQSVQEADHQATESRAAEHEADIEDWLAESDRLAEVVSTGWKDNMTAPDAVKEQRREL